MNICVIRDVGFKAGINYSVDRVTPLNQGVFRGRVKRGRVTVGCTFNMYIFKKVLLSLSKHHFYMPNSHKTH